MRRTPLTKTQLTLVQRNHPRESGHAGALWDQRLPRRDLQLEPDFSIQVTICHHAVLHRELHRIVPSASSVATATRLDFKTILDAKCKVKGFDDLNQTHGPNAKILQSEPYLFAK